MNEFAYFLKYLDVQNIIILDVPYSYLSLEDTSNQHTVSACATYHEWGWQLKKKKKRKRKQCTNWSVRLSLPHLPTFVRTVPNNREPPNRFPWRHGSTESSNFPFPPFPTRSSPLLIPPNHTGSCKKQPIIFISIKFQLES